MSCGFTKWLNLNVYKHFLNDLQVFTVWKKLVFPFVNMFFSTQSFQWYMLFGEFTIPLILAVMSVIYTTQYIIVVRNIMSVFSLYCCLQILSKLYWNSMVMYHPVRQEFWGVSIRVVVAELSYTASSRDQDHTSLRVSHSSHMTALSNPPLASQTLLCCGVKKP